MINNYEFIPTETAYDIRLNRNVRKVRYHAKKVLFAVAIFCRYLFFIITRKKAKILSFSVLDHPISGLPVVLHVQVSNALYFLLNGKKYPPKTNIVFLSKDFQGKKAELEVVGVDSTQKTSLPIPYLKVTVSEQKLVSKGFEIRVQRHNKLKPFIQEFNTQHLDVKIQSNRIKTSFKSTIDVNMNVGNYADFKQVVNQLETEPSTKHQLKT